jgi:hypothetical protein
VTAQLFQRPWAQNAFFGIARNHWSIALREDTVDLRDGGRAEGPIRRKLDVDLYVEIPLAERVLLHRKAFFGDDFDMTGADYFAFLCFAQQLAPIEVRDQETGKFPKFGGKQYIQVKTKLDIRDQELAHMAHMARILQGGYMCVI